MQDVVGSYLAEGGAAVGPAGNSAAVGAFGVKLPEARHIQPKGPVYRNRFLFLDYADLCPTLLQFANYDPKPHYQRIDRRSLASLLTDPSNQKHGYPRDTHYWHYPFNVGIINPDDGLPPAPHSAIREGDDKLIFDWSGKLYLYDLKTDWREEHNLADVQTEKTGALFKKLNAWLNQNVAVKYMRAAAEEKLSVPRNLSVVGVDDIPLGEYLPVALTTISQPIKDMVARTASLLVQRIDGKSAVRPSQTIFPTELLIRESTARVPGRIRR